MKLKCLNPVKTILETGNFQNTVRKFNYTQSAITFQIHQLEHERRMKPFEKISRKMALTQLGILESVLKTVEKIVNHGKISNELTDTLKVTFPESLPSLIYKM